MKMRLASWIQLCCSIGVLLSLFSAPLQAGSPLKVLDIYGAASWNGKNIRRDDVFQDLGSISTRPGSWVKVAALNWDHTILVGGNSEVEFRMTSIEDRGNYYLKKGSLRWLSSVAKDKATAERFHVATPRFALGARGTDFYVSHNAFSGESELHVFSGAVLARAENDARGQQLVKQGLWLGLGGRFGESLGKPVKLAAPVVEQVKARLRF